MEVDRYMANLFFEIKRNLPPAQKSSMKIADSDLGERMVDLYKSTNNDSIKVLIKSFLEHAGEEWSKKIELKPKRYRGAEQNTEESKQSVEAEPSGKQARKKVRYYRGVRIEE